MVRRNRASRRKTRRAGVKAGRTYKNLVGTRAEVWHRTAFKTSYVEMPNLLKMKANSLVVFHLA